jgi:hypothetical protein
VLAALVAAITIDYYRMHAVGVFEAFESAEQERGIQPQLWAKLKHNFPDHITTDIAHATRDIQEKQKNRIRLQYSARHQLDRDARTTLLTASDVDKAHVLKCALPAHATNHSMPLVMKLLRPHFTPSLDDGLGSGGGVGNGGPSPLTSRPGGVFRMEPGVDPVACVSNTILPSEGSANEEWAPSLLLQTRGVKMGMATVEYFQK